LEANTNRSASSRNARSSALQFCSDRIWKEILTGVGAINFATIQKKHLDACHVMLFYFRFTSGSQNSHANLDPMVKEVN
jgi:hypothetical protein